MAFHRSFKPTTPSPKCRFEYILIADRISKLDDRNEWPIADAFVTPINVAVV